jgi:hypothetical protein
MLWQLVCGSVSMDGSEGDDNTYWHWKILGSRAPKQYAMTNAMKAQTMYLNRLLGKIRRYSNAIEILIDPLATL